MYVCRVLHECRVVHQRRIVWVLLPSEADLCCLYDLLCLLALLLQALPGRHSAPVSLLCLLLLQTVQPGMLGESPMNTMWIIADTIPKLVGR